MRVRRVRLVALLAAVVLAGILAFLATRPVEQGATFVISPLIGTSAPDVVASTLSGDQVSLEGLQGRVVVLSFFASWCTACRTEAPNLVSLAWRAHLTRSKTSVLGIVFSDSDAAAGDFARRVGISYPILKDPLGAIANDFGVVALPVTVVIDAKGRIAAVLQGPATTSQLVAAMRSTP
jgi:cytochrome c biogenesis protein CcmG/thiol:disulfide interchange protein DsbE